MIKYGIDVGPPNTYTRMSVHTHAHELPNAKKKHEYTYAHHTSHTHTEIVACNLYFTKTWFLILPLLNAFVKSVCLVYMCMCVHPFVCSWEHRCRSPPIGVRGQAWVLDLTFHFEAGSLVCCCTGQPGQLALKHPSILLTLPPASPQKHPNYRHE